MGALLRFKNPKRYLGLVVARHLAEAGVDVTQGAGRIDSR